MKKSHSRFTHHSIEKSIDKLLTLIAYQKRQSGLMPIDLKEYKKKFQEEVNEEIAYCVDEFEQRMRLGATTIFERLEAANQEISHKAIAELQKAISLSEDGKESLMLMIQKMEECKTLREFLGFSDEVMEEFYRIAFVLHEQQDFKRASDCFYFLCAVDPWVYSFWVGYGYSEQMLHRASSALYAYAIATLIDAKNPIPQYLSAQCYEEQHNIPEAVNALNLVLETINDGPEHQPLKEIALKMKARLS